MIDKLKKILEDGEQRIAKTLSETELQDVKASLLGKQGVFTEVMKEMRLNPSLQPSLTNKDWNSSLKPIKLMKILISPFRELPLQVQAVCTPLLRCAMTLMMLFVPWALRFSRKMTLQANFTLSTNLTFRQITLQEKAWIPTGLKVMTRAVPVINFAYAPT